MDVGCAALRGLQRATAAIDNNPGPAIVVLTAFYAGGVVALSSMKLMWLDEFITLHIAQLGSVSAIWHALARGADPNPPLTHLLVLACLRIFGVHELALRLPAMVGYWIGMLALYLFLQRRLSATWALAGVVMSMSMAAFEYSYESRSYGIFYGLAMLSFYCWSRTIDPIISSIRRRAALVGMTLALAAGISTSYIAVLAFFRLPAESLYARSMQSAAVSGANLRFGTQSSSASGLRWLSLPRRCSLIDR